MLIVAGEGKLEDLTRSITPQALSTEQTLIYPIQMSLV